MSEENVARETLLEIKSLKNMVESLKKRSQKIIKASVKSAVNRLCKKSDGSRSKENSMILRNGRKVKHSGAEADNCSTLPLRKRRLLQKRNKQSKKDRRDKETEVERQLRLEKLAQCKRDRRARETAEERTLRLQKQAEQARYRRSKETEEERKVRLKKQAELIKERRAKRVKTEKIQEPKNPPSLKISKKEKVSSQKNRRRNKPEDQSSFQCDLCPKHFTLRKYLTKHRRIVHENSVCCEICGKQYKDARYLKIHRCIQDGENKNEKLPPIVCEECGKTFAHKSSYRAHCLATHNSDRQFQCTICGKRFTCQSSLHIHKIQFCEKDKAKPAPCPICGKVLENYILLSYHKTNFHKFGNTAENVCHVCKKTLPSSFSLYNHNKYHHGEDRNSICSVCGKFCRNRVLLFDHWRTHRQEKPFQCSVCLVTFQQRCSFYQHRKIAHECCQGQAKVIVDGLVLKRMKKEFNWIHSVSSVPTDCNVEQEASVTMAINGQEINQQDDCSASDNGEVVMSGDDGLDSTSEKNKQDSDDTLTQLPVEKIDSNATFIELSRVNVPESSIRSPTPSEEFSSGTGIKILKATSVSQPKFKLEKLTEYLSFVSNVENLNHEEHLVDYNEVQEDSPSDDNFEGLYVKDEKDSIFFREEYFPGDPVSLSLRIELERLEERTCYRCDVIFHKSLCYRKHLQLSCHGSVVKNHSSLPKGLQTQYEVSRKETTANEEDDSFCFTCEFCGKEYLNCLSFKNQKTKKIKKLAANSHRVNKSKISKSSEKTLSRDVCEICGKEVRNLKTHRRTHTGEKPFKCDHCPKSFNSKVSRKFHIETEHLGQKHSCDICGVKIERLYQYRLHKESHEREKDKRHFCDQCPHSYVSGAKLRHHLRSVHKISDEKNVSEKLTCPDCGKQYPDNHALKMHMKKHSEILPFTCSLCFLKFRTQAIYDKHLGLHDSSRPFKCQICSCFFTFSSHLVRHVQSNHQKEEHVCDICKKVFTRGDTLNKHLSRCHKDKHIYKCNQCSCSFVSAGSLRYHVDSVHTEKKHVCKFCDEEFPDRISLQDHRKIHASENSAVLPVFTCSVCSQHFRRQVSLDKHFGIHDANRPFACDSCPSYFNHHSNLTLHKKNVHQKLGIDYRKKKRNEAPIQTL